MITLYYNLSNPKITDLYLDFQRNIPDKTNFCSMIYGDGSIIKSLHHPLDLISSTVHLNEVDSG
ncbi:MAG: hypothetical protein RIS91_217 [Bacteroidota bacterium]|jgi:hypothetical protein